MIEKMALGSLDQAKAWFQSLPDHQRYALVGSLVGGGTMGALNMARLGRGNRIKGFLSGAAMGGLAGAGAGLAGERIMRPTPKVEPKAPPVTPTAVTDQNAPAPPAPTGGGDPTPAGLLPDPDVSGALKDTGKTIGDTSKAVGRRLLLTGSGATAGALTGGSISAARNALRMTPVPSSPGFPTPTLSLLESAKKGFRPGWKSPMAIGAYSGGAGVNLLNLLQSRNK